MNKNYKIYGLLLGFLGLVFTSHFLLAQSNGDLRYNDSSNQVEVYESSSWRAIPGYGNVGSCTASAEGSIRYNSSSNRMEYCNGANLISLDSTVTSTSGACPAGEIRRDGSIISFCNGSGYQEINPASVNGSCGSSNNDCIAGVSSDLSDTSTNFQWRCDGQFGGSNSGTCTALRPGLCGSAESGAAVASQPTSNLCTTGTFQEVSDTGSQWLWNCTGSSTDNCARARFVETYTWITGGWGSCSANATWSTGGWGSCSANATWSTGGWGSCTVSCGGGLQYRSVSCPAASGTQTRSVSCPAASGSQSRSVYCRRDSDSATVSDSFCSGTKPASSQSCTDTTCSGSAPASSQSCTDTTCSGSAPASSQSCNTHSCPTGCSATNFSDCQLSATSNGGTSGSCSEEGTCSYKCTSGSWVLQSNACTPFMCGDVFC